MKFRRNKKGFTIIELVIVIAVIGVLAAILIPTFVNLSNKANQAADEALVKNLNTALATREQEIDDTKNNTFHDAVLDLDRYGYKLPNLVTKSDDKLLWNQETNRFILEDRDGDEIAKYPKVHFWRIQDSVEENQEYSVYAGNNFTSTLVNVGVGFDVGYQDGITKIKYAHADVAQDVVIRTNSIETELSVDAKLDTIHHYDLIGAVEVIRTADGSYHEFGTAGFVKVASGRVVAEKGGKINTVVIINKDNNADITAVIENNGGTIDSAYAISAELVNANNAADRSVQLSTTEDVVDESQLDNLEEIAKEKVIFGDSTPITKNDLKDGVLYLDSGTYHLKEDITIQNEDPNDLDRITHNIKIVGTSSESKDVTINLAGHVLANQKETDESSAIWFEYSSLTIIDSIGGGAILNNCTNLSSYAIQGAQSNVSLKVENGTIGGTNPIGIGAAYSTINIQTDAGNITNLIQAPFGTVVLHNKGTFRITGYFPDMGVPVPVSGVKDSKGNNLQSSGSGTLNGVPYNSYTIE